ncbi:hypothetical protein Fmac_003304 [Flemingia macrophylla]|uniref:CAND6/7 N-terminal domain-containing protein n=1 Tax=Flemingia macrophylla TaxID=520843 RepID=A0ABD1NMD9_9FABA
MADGVLYLGVQNDDRELKEGTLFIGCRVERGKLLVEVARIEIAEEIGLMTDKHAELNVQVTELDEKLAGVEAKLTDTKFRSRSFGASSTPATPSAPSPSASFSLPPSSSFNRTYPVTISNEYSLLFVNCNPDTTVSMSLRALQPQPYPHLPLLAHTHLPSLFFLFSVACFSFFAFSLSLTKHLLLLANTLNLLSTVALKHRLNLADTPRASDHILFFLSRFVRVVLLFAPCLICSRHQPHSFAQTLGAFPHSLARSRRCCRSPPGPQPNRIVLLPTDWAQRRGSSPRRRCTQGDVRRSRIRRR